MAILRRSPDALSTAMRPTAPWAIGSFTTPTANCCIVPQMGRLELANRVRPHPGRTPGDRRRSARHTLSRRLLSETSARGYVCENYGAPLRLPDLGPIGSNGLANARDFLAPVAWFEDRDEPCRAGHQVLGPHLWQPARSLAVRRRRLAWQSRALQVRPASVQRDRFDQLRPSGSVDLSRAAIAQRHAAASTPSTSSIFPPRWLAMEATFRPPWYHRNVASEFMGLIHGQYDAKAGGFVPGGASLHNCMTAHGPDTQTFERASAADLSEPHRLARHDGVHVRDALRHPGIALRSGHSIAPGRLRALLARDGAAFFGADGRRLDRCPAPRLARTPPTIRRCAAG